ncbi:PGF-CTERM sorting domain-containing protein [Halobacteria archaeon HArc-gm2]|nr:PGF-CTERM sorting domain-containing protein [Halobacteria archaeon HArc-gm2]
MLIAASFSLIGGAATVISAENVSEEAYAEPVPTPGDPYFEAEDPDGEWISYVNPRDEYRSPYIGNGSAKICLTLLNEAGNPIVGKTVPNTTVTVPTGDSTAWHSSADPITVQFPLTEHYDRPLDADQFGTNPDLPQGDGYLDSHCIEFHGLSSNATIKYGKASIDGPSAHKIELVGYIEKSRQTWDSAVDPTADTVSYRETGGGWSFTPQASHGQVVVVLQLGTEETGDERSAELSEQTSDDTESSEEDDSTGSDTSTPLSNGEARVDHDNGTRDHESVSSGVVDRLVLPGAGLLAMIGLLAVAWRSRLR